MFGENLDLFLTEFGVDCVFGGFTFRGLLDQPDELVAMPHASTVSRESELTYASTAAELVRDMAGTVEGKPYRVREVPRQFGDGAFSRVILARE